MDVAIQTDHVDSQEILNLLIQRDMEEQKERKMKAKEGGVKVMKHYQQDPDAIHRLNDGSDSRSDVSVLQRSPNPSLVQPQLTTTSSSARHYSDSKGNRSEQSLSDRICQVVWSRKESAPFVTPFGSKKIAYSSGRRGTAPNVPFILSSFDRRPDAFERSQSFKGSSSSGSFKNRSGGGPRDPLSRRTSSSAVAVAMALEAGGFYPRSSLKTKSKAHKVCTAEEKIDNRRNNLRQNDVESPYSSMRSSKQNLCSKLNPDQLEKKIGGGLASNIDGEMDMRRQTSMTLSIPSRENSVRSCSSSKSYGSFSPVPTPDSSPKKVARGQMKPSTRKLVRYGSNPDVFPSRQTKWKEDEQEIFYQGSHAKVSSSKSLTSCGQARSRSGSNIGPTFPGAVSHTSNFIDKKKQILSEKQKRNEKVAWAVHVGFSILLILAITCIVVFLRLSSSMLPPTSTFENVTSTNENHTVLSISTPDLVRKENENLLQSIQPQLNILNMTTPQPTTHTQQVQDNSIANPDNSNGNNDRSISSLHSGQSLTLTRITSSTSSSEDTEGDIHRTSNNKTTPSNLDSLVIGEEVENSYNRSNNRNSNNSNSANNPSLKSISIRPKRSRPRIKLHDFEGSARSSSIIINALSEKVNMFNDTPGFTKARHLESSIGRFFKNSNSQGVRKKRNLESEPQIL